jgi:hypothetical protein
MRHYSSSPSFTPMKPIPLVSIDTRKHLLPDPVRTRLGVGEAFIDHAAGMPLRVRRSAPPVAPVMASMASYAPPGSANVWDERENVHDPNLLRQPIFANDDPVDLPLQSRTTAYVTMVALIVALLGVVGAILMGGRSTASADATGDPESSGSIPAVHNPSR